MIVCLHPCVNSPRQVRWNKNSFTLIYFVKESDKGNLKVIGFIIAIAGGYHLEMGGMPLHDALW